MKSNVITNWLLTLFSMAIMGSAGYVGTKLNKLEVALTAVQIAYAIEMPDIKEDIININKDLKYFRQIIAIKEEEDD